MNYNWFIFWNCNLQPELRLLILSYLICNQWPICTIGSRDYCHAPLGVSFLFSVQNVWEMTTMVDKTACRSCTVCLPAIILRLSIADTISSDNVYSEYVKALHMWQKHGKFYCHYCRTTARPTKNQLIFWQPAKMIFPRLHYTAGPSQLLSW